MIKFICFLLFILHNIAIFKYSSNVNTTQIKNYKLYYLIHIINTVLIILFVNFNSKIHESLFIFIYFLTILIELKLLFNTTWLKNIFAVSCFTINLFSIKLILISLISIIWNIPIYKIIQQPKIYLILVGVTLFFTNLYLLIFLVFFPLKNINTLMISKENLKSSIRILISIFIFLFLNSYLLYIKIDFKLISYLTLKIGICSIVLFLATLKFSYIFSKLQLYVIKAKNMEKEIEQNEILLNNLKNQVIYDDFTSCFKRDFIYEKIDELLKDTPFFCLAFVDIDGLKITNDIYGHDEGDFYIKAVANILNKEFVGKIVSRIGGDEFLILLNLTDIYATTKCLIRCYENAVNIAKENNKPYQTSISYGVVQVTPENTLSREELIKIADEQMYNFKKLRKKNRK